MKTTIFGILGGSLLLFIWQFLSWGPLHIHRNMQKHSPYQQKILDCLENGLVEEGLYLLPNAPDGASVDEFEMVMTEGLGKPWAQIYYHKSFEVDMTSEIIRSLFNCIFITSLVWWVLTLIPNLTVGLTLVVSISIGFIGFLNISLTEAIWFDHNPLADLIDTGISYTLLGLWLALVIFRKKSEDDPIKPLS